MRTSTLLPIVGLVSLAGCVEYEYASFEGVDVFYQDPPSEVDILMVWTYPNVQSPAARSRVAREGYRGASGRGPRIEQRDQGALSAVWGRL